MQFSGGMGRELDRQNCTILGGNWELDVGSLVAKTTEFLKANRSQLLGT